MKRVLFIAEMNEIVKNMNEAMLPSAALHCRCRDGRAIAPYFSAGHCIDFFKPVKQGRCDGVKYIIKRECEPSDCGSWQHV